MSDVTRILSAIERGDSNAAEQLLPLVYDELRKRAAEMMANERPGQTLEGTALVHEAYVRLVDAKEIQHWNSRGHFFAAAAEAMRRILIENARRKKTEKHGGDRQRLNLSNVDAIAFDDAERWLLLEDALLQFAKEDPSAAQVAKLRLFGFLSTEEIAEVLGIARATAFRHWTYARAWLHAALAENNGTE
jgi:RNA polymerase sigma factor (TIGR02999 family)